MKKYHFISPQGHVYELALTAITVYENTIEARSIAEKRAVELISAYHTIARLTNYSEREQHLERLYHEALSIWYQAKNHGWI